MVFTVVLTMVLLIYFGYQYYNTRLDERFFHPQHENLKPSGILGHGYGIIGSVLMLVGVITYLLRKRLRSWSRLGVLSHWLEFHIFLCTLGPILILFHTSFKFGGLVAISFWSMVAVFLSGVIGRFIYIQIPRTIEGRELDLNEVRNLKTDFGNTLIETYKLEKETVKLITDSTRRKIGIISTNSVYDFMVTYFQDRHKIKNIRKMLKINSISRKDNKRIIQLIKNDISLNRKIDRLTTMQKLFKYWHVAHLPFAFLMLIIMIIHVVVTIVFGYRWIL